MIARCLAAFLVAGATAVVTGCSSTARYDLSGRWERPNGHLLFDRVMLPGAKQASSFVDRPEWPSTPGTSPVFESTAYRETIVNQQGPGYFGWPDRSYRRFIMYRDGAGYR